MESVRTHGRHILSLQYVLCYCIKIQCCARGRIMSCKREIMELVAKMTEQEKRDFFEKAVSYLRSSDLEEAPRAEIPEAHQSLIVSDRPC